MKAWSNWTLAKITQPRQIAMRQFLPGYYHLINSRFSDNEIKIKRLNFANISVFPRPSSGNWEETYLFLWKNNTDSIVHPKLSFYTGCEIDEVIFSKAGMYGCHVTTVLCRYSLTCN